MNIHSIINHRQWVSECDNVLNSEKKPKTEQERTPYLFVSLCMQGAAAYNKDLVSSDYYCHDCSSEYGRPIHHSTTDYFNDFRTKWKKYAKELQDIHSTLY